MKREGVSCWTEKNFNDNDAADNDDNYDNNDGNDDDEAGFD